MIQPIWLQEKRRRKRKIFISTMGTVTLLELQEIVARMLAEQFTIFGGVERVKVMTRVQTGALRDSTRLIVDGPTIYLVQGGTVDPRPVRGVVDYAVDIELRYGDFSRSALSAVRHFYNVPRNVGATYLTF